MLRRSGTVSVAGRPSIETFGENVGILTSTVFGLEVTSTGFRQLLKQAAENSTYERVVEDFGQQLGAEARALARSLVVSHEAERRSELSDPLPSLPITPDLSLSFA
jgi:hypothetical protein